MNQKTKNDDAWEKLFEKYKILEIIAQKKCFEINSSQINEFRESRLMAKLDHNVNLPKIFRDNKLSILPISRSRYIIGYFNIHHEVNYNREITVDKFERPKHLEIIDHTNLFSESSVLHFAFNAKIIDDLIGEETFCTVSGRMSTDCFKFKIKNIKDDSFYDLEIENSQCEVDGGFESENHFLLIEVKNYSVDNFCIRQLYYPYRLWSDKTSKKILPILMTYSNDKFSFFVYKFDNNLEYNSLSLIEQKTYVVQPEPILTSEVSDVFNSIEIISDTNNIPFPQANKFERVVDLLSLLAYKDLTKEEITESYQFSERDTQYYTDAGRYLELINKKYTDYEPTKKEIVFCLSAEGKSIMKKNHKLKVLALIKKVLQHEIFYQVFKLASEWGAIPSTEIINDLISINAIEIKGETISRRSSTVKRWIEWIWDQIDD